MHVRLLDESDAQLYREIRLRSLKNNPEAFLTTYEMEVNKPLETTVERLKPTKGKFSLGAFDDHGAIIGIVTFVRDSNLKIAHKGNVYGMYVEPDKRGQGIGKALMQELIRTAKACDGLEQINLTVVSTQVAAKRLYVSMGFNVYGTERNALKSDGQYFDEDLMVFKIN